MWAPLLEAAEPDSDLATVLAGLRADVLSQEDLPDPQTEWDDALRRIEFDSASSKWPSWPRAGWRRKRRALHGAESAHDGAERCRHTLNTLKSGFSALAADKS